MTSVSRDGKGGEGGGGRVEAQSSERLGGVAGVWCTSAVAGVWCTSAVAGVWCTSGAAGMSCSGGVALGGGSCAHGFSSTE